MYAKINDSVDIYHLVRAGNDSDYEVAPSYQKVECGVFPASNDIMAIYPAQNSYQLFEIFIYENVTLKNGDKLISFLNNKEYIVRGVPQVHDTNLMFYTKVVGEQVVGT